MTTIGALRWDPMTGNNSLDTTNELGSWNRIWLGPAKYHYRAPFYMAEASPTSLTGRSDTQAVCDEEIRKAAGIGIDYFVYNFVPGQQGFFPAYPSNGQVYTWIDANASLRLHQSSPVAHLTKICVNLICNFGIGVPALNDVSSWGVVQTYLATLFQNPNYMTVLGGRPLMFLYDPDGFVASPFAGNATNAKASLDSLRTACIAATGKNPYIVGNSAATGFSNFSSLGFDAASYYTLFPTSMGQSYASFAASVETAWDAFASTPEVPNCSTGVDYRPISDNPIAGSSSVYYGEGTPGNWNIGPTDAEFATHIANCLAWIAANPTKAPADTLWIYAWAEPTECAQILCPTLGNNGSLGQMMAQRIGRQKDSPRALRARGYTLNTRF